MITEKRQRELIATLMLSITTTEDKYRATKELLGAIKAISYRYHFNSRQDRQEFYHNVLIKLYNNYEYYKAKDGVIVPIFFITKNTYANYVRTIKRQHETLHMVLENRVVSPPITTNESDRVREMVWDIVCKYEGMSERERRVVYIGVMEGVRYNKVVGIGEITRNRYNNLLTRIKAKIRQSDEIRAEYEWQKEVKDSYDAQELTRENHRPKRDSKPSVFIQTDTIALRESKL